MQYCGREFTAGEIDLIRELLAASPPLSRYRLSPRSLRAPELATRRRRAQRYELSGGPA